MMKGLKSMKFFRFTSNLADDISGIALTEFAISFPIMLALGMYGIDTANFALTHLRLNQIALNLADNASRVGANNASGLQEMREIDVIDVFQAAKTQGTSINLDENAWVTLSSLEKDSSDRQRIHWQRCFGQNANAAYKSHYGKVLDADGSTADVDANGNKVIDDSEMNGQRADEGLGDATLAKVDRVNAPISDSGVMFVEINYRYTPMFSWLSAPADLRYVGSFIIRDKRNFAQIVTTSGTTPAYCGHAARAAPPPVPT